MMDELDTAVLKLTATIVSAHIRNNQVAANALPKLIQSVHRSLATADTAEPEPAPRKLAVSIRRSVFPNYIVCLEDGRKLKLLKRHLQTSYGMTPEHYRQKWGLPASYPMVAPDYARYRSSLAKQNGLGRKWGNSVPEQVNPTKKSGKPNLPAEPAVIRGRARRARRSKG